MNRYNLIMVLILWSISTYGIDIHVKGKVTVYPAPAGETLSGDYHVSVNGINIPVYLTKVARANQGQREISANYYDTAAFAFFDMLGKVNVTVTIPGTVNTAKILPSSLGIKYVIRRNSLTFTITSPGNLTVEINGKCVRSLHIFANPFDIDAPRPDDPNIIYFGPGIHEISHLVVGDNKTLYIAGGAILHAVIRTEEKNNSHGEYPPSIELLGQNIKVCGRGIIDGTNCRTHSRNMIFIHGRNIKLEGIILRDASMWTVPIRRSDHVVVNNIKLFGYRSNSDGIDICNSRDVTVENCFIRTSDDLIVVKTDKGQGMSSNIVARGCVLWNQFAHALSIGAEVSEDVNNVLFTDCDIIHDRGREWSLRIFQCNSARISNVHFENIRIEEAHKCISLWIGKAVWSSDSERGHIRGVVFKNIYASGSPLTVSLVGIDEGHAINDVLFQNVLLNGKALSRDEVKANDFVKKMVIRP
ncbi:MAG: glycosyl hydrolase family 28 protein [Bacteroidota bacterium]|nr:glycosyl hydrolase family 28 protein [Bacteroidota bacterium]